MYMFELKICFSKTYKYDTDFFAVVNLFGNRENSTILQESKKVLVSGCLEMQIQELKQRWGTEMSCHVITSVWRKDQNFDPKNFGVELIMYFQDQYALQRVTTDVTISSKENYYGMTFGRWFLIKSRCSKVLARFSGGFSGVLRGFSGCATA